MDNSTYKAPYFDGSQPCAQTDPEIFFPETALEASKIIGHVRRICGGCDFRQECLEYSLDNDVFGAWGGLLESEIKKLKKQRKLNVA